MSRIFKSPLKFSPIILYFHFYNDFIFRIFINVVFVNIALQMKYLIYACCMCFVPQKFVLNLFFILQDSRQEETKTLESLWLIVGKRLSVELYSQKKHVFNGHPLQKVKSCRRMGRRKNWIDLNWSLHVTVISLMIQYFFTRKKLLDWTTKLNTTNQNRNCWTLFRFKALELFCGKITLKYMSFVLVYLISLIYSRAWLIHMIKCKVL